MKAIAINTNLSYFRIRKIIGYLGALLPYMVAGAAREWLPSISDYYYSVSTLIFTGTLILTGIFLISYRGYQAKGEVITDNIITNIAGALLIIVAFVPTPYIGGCPDGSCSVMPFCHCDNGWGAVHFISASVFFLLMGYLSFFHFTRGSKEALKDPDKKLRNRIYRICGIVIWSVLIITAVVMLFIGKDKVFNNFIYWMEAIMLLFFGISWWVKGKGLVDFKIQKEKEKLTESETQQMVENWVSAIASAKDQDQILRDIEDLIQKKK